MPEIECKDQMPCVSDLNNVFRAEVPVHKHNESLE
jgi:hypothetical protein